MDSIRSNIKNYTKSNSHMQHLFEAVSWQLDKWLLWNLLCGKVKGNYYDFWSAWCAGFCSVCHISHL